MKTKSMRLIKPKYPYGKDQVYFPSNLLLVAARLKEAGVQATVHDLNLHNLPDNLEEDSFGISVIGAPYVPGAKSLTERLREETGKPVVLGGAIIEKLPPEHFERIFGRESVQVRTDTDLSSLVDISSLPSPYETSITPMLSTIPEKNLERYLANEFAFFIAQGCKFRCDFCAADKQRAETYRSSEVVADEIGALTEKAKEFGLTKMTMYLSSLDLFQSPQNLAEVLEVFARTSADSGVEYELRGLARIDSFLRALDRVPELYDLIPQSGVKVVGFGIDGTTEKVWKSQHKGQKSLSKIDEGFDKCTEVGITPEILMVMGFPEDTLGSLAKNYAYTVARAITHGAVARPYVAKQFTPGNAGWNNPKYQREIEMLLDNPRLFVDLDYAIMGSPLTHPNPVNRVLSNMAYVALVATLEPFGRNATYPLVPRLHENGILSRVRNRVADYVNRVMPFDK